MAWIPGHESYEHASIRSRATAESGSRLLEERMKAYEAIGHAEVFAGRSTMIEQQCAVLLLELIVREMDKVQRHARQLRRPWSQLPAPRVRDLG